MPKKIKNVILAMYYNILNFLFLYCNINKPTH